MNNFATSPKLIDKTSGKNIFNTIFFQQSLSKIKTHFHSKRFRTQKKYISLPKRKRPFNLLQKKASRSLENGGGPKQKKNPYNFS